MVAMSYRTTDEQRIRRKLRRLQHDDDREDAASGMAAITKALRARLQLEFPDALAGEIEQKVAAHMTAGSKPTTAVVLPAVKLPAHARRTARRAR